MREARANGRRAGAGRLKGMTSPRAPRAEAGAGDTSDEVPRRLREARERSGLSLRQLAKRLEISPSALSQIETGKSRPSVRTLYAVVSELGISLDQLFDHGAGVGAEQRPGSEPAVDNGWVPSGSPQQPLLREPDRPVLELDTGVQWQRLTADHDAFVDFLHVTYEPGGTSNADGKLVRHAGREYGVVLSGRLTVTVGFETYELGAGDSISFNSDEPHVLANNTDTPATAIWFVLGRRQSDPRQPTFDSPAGDSASA
jgi:transcriptional regulator with XRE-family HTH domain/quercetin dioxygenase-like cupin family protein